METKKQIFAPPTATSVQGRKRYGRWLCLLLLLMMFMPATAQRDVITFTGAKVGAADAAGEFKTGAASTEYPGVYVIDVGDADISEGIFTVTLSRPQGASATRPATVTLTEMYTNQGETVTFEPGETTKTVELPAVVMPVDGYEDTNGEWHEVYTWSGNIPSLYSVTTSHADAEYEVLMLKANRTGAEAPRQSTYATKLEVLQNTFGNDHASYAVTRWGEYMLFHFILSTDVKIGTDSRYVINARFADHTNLTADDDDYGMAQMHEVELHPINAGSICNEAWYIYRPSPDEYLHSLSFNKENDTERAVEYPVLEVGPFEVANPAEDAVRYIFYSRSDLPEESTNSLYSVYLQVDALMPQFSNVHINKTAFKSGETMIITATMDNWQFVKRCQGNRFRSAFGVTLDDNETMEPGRYTFDEATGQVTYYVTAPTVSETKTIYVDFGPAVGTWNEKKVQTWADGGLAVTVSPETATANPITQFDIPGLPNGSLIILKEIEKFIMAGWVEKSVIPKKYAIDPAYLPLDATNANQVVYSVTNADGANAELTYYGLEGITLSTGTKTGSFTLTASVNGETLFSRTYTLTTQEGEEELAMPEPMNHTNHYYIGTVFPQFQFEMKNPDNRLVDDAITVNYTHANGTTWTETYSLKTLKSRKSDRESIIYNLPFGFTDEHPDITDNSQVGNTVITAQVFISVPTTEGPKETIECTAILVSDMKKPSFGDYSEMTAYWNEVHPVTLTSEAFYLPSIGFTVGYEIPELGVKETYNNLTDGDNVPDWLELHKDDYYYSATITVQPEFTPSVSKYHLYTLAQRSYSPDEVMVREMTCIADLQYVGAEGHIVYKVNGEDETGNLNFDNTQAIQNLRDAVDRDGFYQDVVDEDSENDPRFKPLISPLHLPSAIFEVDDNFYEGANITLKCGEVVIQTLNGYKGRFFFQPPADGKTYEVEVYFTGYDRRYTSTFKSVEPSDLYHFDVVLISNTNSAPASLKYYKDGQVVTYNIPQVSGSYSWQPSWGTYYNNYLKGIIRMDNPANCYLTVGNETIRLSLNDYAASLKPNVKPELSYPKYHDDGRVSVTMLERTIDIYNNLTAGVLSGNIHGSYATSERGIRWEDLSAGNTQVRVVNAQGNPITDATVNYACVDANMACQDTKGMTTYDNEVGCYPISTDPYNYAELIEVVAPGYQPVLATMTLWNYDYNSRENRGKQRRFTIILQQQDEQLQNLSLETLRREGNLKDNMMDVAINSDDLLSINNSETLNYSQTADYKEAIKHLPDPKFGENGWTGTKYAHIIGCMPYQSTPDLALTSANGSLNLQPTQKLLTTVAFPFSTNYCLFDFDLADQIAEYATVQPELKNGDETLAKLPSLHNHTVDLMALNEANNIDMEPGGFDLREVDNEAEENGTDMKDMGKAFDKFSFQLPPVLPFTVNIERNGNFFTVRAVCEKNFVPGGEVMDALDQLEDLQYFDEQFQACMDAVNSAQPADDDFFDDIPRWPSAFVGIKGYLSGIGHYNPETGKLDINFLEGGLTFEASAAAQANLSFGIGSFGMSIDAKIAMTMGLVNTAAEMGDVASTKIDFMFDYQTRLKICAWAYAGIDIWIAKAVAGVRGGACIDLHHRAYIRKGQAGMKTTLQAQMEAFAEVRFLFWKAKKTWPIFKAYKEYLTPNNTSNPFHPSNPEPIFSVSRQNVTKSYKKLRRKALRALDGTTIISGVNGMAQPTYMLGGNSLLFNNLIDPDEYNDDRIQIYSNGSTKNFVKQTDSYTPVDAPMYDFAEAHNSNGFEVVAFEQIKETLNGDALEAMEDNDQMKAVTEKSEIHVAMRNRNTNESWTTEPVGVYWSDGVACVTPAVAVDDQGKAVVVWQQGIAKFNDQGDRYIEGSLMMSRYDGNYWGEPIEIKRLNRRNVPVDYQLSLRNDTVLVMMTLQQDVNNEEKSTSVVYVNIDNENKVRERYTLIGGSKPQMVTVNGSNLVGFLKVDGNGRDIELSTVNMKGQPTGKLSGLLGMTGRMVNDFRLVVEDNPTDLSDVALVWSQSDQESTDNGDGTVDINISNRLYASKLCSNDKQLYFSTPVVVATMPDGLSLASMDGYVDGLDMKVAYCVTNDEDGGGVKEVQVAFRDTIEHKISFNPYDVVERNTIPVTVTVTNNGYEPIKDILLTLNGFVSSYPVSIMPQESTEVKAYYNVPDDFDGTINYDVIAVFTEGNSNSLKVRRMAASRPHRIKQSGTQANVRQVDMALKVLSKRTNADGVTTIVAEVNNASLLPLASDMTVKVGLYNSPIVDGNAVSLAEVTVNASDLYDADNHQNMVKIVTLTAPQPDLDQTLYLCTTPMVGSEVLKDVRPANNVLPVSVKGKYLLGDANGDGTVNIADVTAIINHINDNTPESFVEKAANVNRDGSINIADVTGVINIINRK